MALYTPSLVPYISLAVGWIGDRLEGWQEYKLSPQFSRYLRLDASTFLISVLVGAAIPVPVGGGVTGWGKWRKGFARAVG